MVILSKAIRLVVNHRCFSTSGIVAVKVCVCGASGGIGQPLSLLLKLSPLVSELSLYDIAKTVGVAADLSHIDRNSITRGYDRPELLKEALTGMEVVVIPAGMPRKPGMSRDDLFNTNASIVRDLAKAIAKYCPEALVAVITNPVNACVPIVAETLRKSGAFDPKRLFGVTTLDSVRASTFVGQLKDLDPTSIHVPVIGGHSGVTIIPVISQTKPQIKFADDEIVTLTKRIQEAGTEIVKAKAGAGSATLSMAHAGAKMALSLCRGLKGEKDIVEYCYVSSKITESSFFASPVVLGPNGIVKNLGLPALSEYEKELLKDAIPELQKNIKKGEDFAST